MVLNGRTLPVLLAVASSLLPPAAPCRAEEPRAADAAGVVRMTRAEYDRLKDEAEAAKLAGPKRKVPDAPPAILSATYAVTVDAARSTLDAAVDVDVSAPDTRTVVSGLGLLDSFTDKGPSPVLVFAEAGKGERLVLHFARAGRYRLTLRTLLPERTERDRRLLEFTALPAGSARLTASSSIRGSELALAAGAGSPAEPLVANAARPIPASTFVRLEVRTPGRVPAVPEKPVVIAETLDVLRPERERLSQRILVRLSVSRGELSTVTLAVPAGSELVSAAIPDDAAPSLDAAKGLLVLTSPRPFRPAETFSFLLSRPLPGGEEPVEAAPTRVAEASAARAWLLVSPTPAREHVPGTVAGLARIDTADLPPLVKPFVEGGTRAYRVSSPDAARLVFRAPVRKVEPPPETVLFEASVLTLLSTKADRVDRHRYVVETRRPSWSLPLDPSEEILSISVDGTPVRPLSEEGALVVLLPQSPSSVRVVELTKKRKAETVPESGDLTVSQPALPAAAALASWTLVLPEEKRYRFVSSTGLAKAGWSRDAGAVTRRYETSSSEWMAQAPPPAPPAVREADDKPRSELSQLDRRANAKEAGAGKKDGEPVPEEPAAVGVEGGAVGGLVGGTSGRDAAAQIQSNVAGIRALPMELEGRGKRLTLRGPVAGAVALSVTLKVKKG